MPSAIFGKPAHFGKSKAKSGGRLQFTPGLETGPKQMIYPKLHRSDIFIGIIIRNKNPAQWNARQKNIVRQRRVELVFCPLIVVLQKPGLSGKAGIIPFVWVLFFDNCALTQYSGALHLIMQNFGHRFFGFLNHRNYRNYRNNRNPLETTLRLRSGCLCLQVLLPFAFFLLPCFKYYGTLHLRLTYRL